MRGISARGYVWIGLTLGSIAIWTTFILTVIDFIERR
jgi:hypothetical protein